LVPATAGSLVVDSGGELRFPSLGVNLQQRYRIELRGTGRSVVSGTGAIGANYGTRFEIGPSAQLALAGPGGYYQGNTDGFTQLSQLVNGGRLLKTGGGTSVIDADYTEVGGGQMVVESGTVAFPDGTTYPARVQPGQRMSTEQCAPTSSFQACALETNPDADPQSISLRIPSGDPGGALVEVRELEVSGARAARRLGTEVFEGLAHADGLKVNPRQPAVIEMRFDERRASQQTISNLAVYRDGKEIQSCLGTTGEPALGQVACVDRRGRGDSSRRTAGNFFIVVRATHTSRWIIRRETTDVAAPTLFTPRKQKKGQLGSPVLVRTECDEACKLRATGFIKVKGLGKLALQKDTAAGRANKSAVLRLALTRASARKLAQSGKKQGIATVTLKARDKAGNAVRQRVTVSLR
jgi:hypothetical protein